MDVTAALALSAPAIPAAHGSLGCADPESCIGYADVTNGLAQHSPGSVGRRAGKRGVLDHFAQVTG